MSEPSAIPRRPAPPMLQVGDVLAGRYRIAGLLGRGGMAEVYAAEHLHLGVARAIKVIRPKYVENHSFVQRFRQEATLLAALDHPHMVQVADYDYTDQGLPYLVMERLYGEDLGQRQAGGQPLSRLAALQVVQQTAEALHAAHEARVIHRDLKPSNLFLCQRPDSPEGIYVKVLDFGIAKVLREDVALPDATGPADLLGTPSYMSPEQITDPRRVDARSDQFSLAVIAWELFAGCRAFPQLEESPYPTLHRVLEVELPPVFSLPSTARQAPPSPPQGSPQPPPAQKTEHEQRIELALARALSKQPERRFASVRDFIAAMQPATAPPTWITRPVPATLPSQVSADGVPQAQGESLAQTRPKKRSPRRGSLGIALAAGALLGGAMLAGSQPSLPFFPARPQAGSLAIDRPGPTSEPAPPPRLASRLYIPSAAPPSSPVPPRPEPAPVSPRSSLAPSPGLSPPAGRPSLPPRAAATAPGTSAGTIRFFGGSPDERAIIERCLRRRISYLQAEGESGEQALLSRWLFFAHPAPRPLHLGMQPELPGRAPITSALRVGLNHCLEASPPPPGAPRRQTEIAACLPGPGARCPKEPHR